jgi:hypothetical protein
MTQAEKNVLLELEKILQTCNQMYSPVMAALTCRNKILVQAYEVAKTNQTTQKKTVAAMDVWKRLHEEQAQISDEEMDVDE